MSIVAKKIMMGSGAVALPSDDQFNRVSFLSHFDGANNGVNNAFDDGSTSNHTITANGNVTQGSFGPFARPDGEWGVDTSGGWTYWGYNVASTGALGDEDFCMECFVFINSFAATQGIASRNLSGTGIGNETWRWEVQTNGTMTMISKNFFGQDAAGLTSSTALTLNTWHHIAAVRQNDTLTFYIDGTARGATSSGSGVFSASDSMWNIGSNGYQTANSTPLQGSMSNFRLVVGSAVYTGNFTAPSSKLTAITNTEMLAYQSNRFVDNSADGNSLTTVSSPAVSAFGPFLTSSVYDPAVNGASAYFDGNGDYLTAGDSTDYEFGAGDFTIEAWVYASSVDNPAIVSKFPNGARQFSLELSRDGNNHARYRALIYIGENGVFSNEYIAFNAWNHIAIVGTASDTTARIYTNGIRNSNTISYSGGVPAGGTDPLRVGSRNSGGFFYYEGYICDLRLLKGTAAYSGASFTLPTVPLTAITNTKLLLNMADGQAIDSTAQNNLTLYGTAKTSTAQKKFGTASLLLDGNSDYAKTSGYVGSITGGKTIECWVYAASISSKMCIWEWYEDDNNLLRLFFEGGNGNVLRLDQRNGGSTIVGTTGATTLSATTWYHLAATRTAAGAWKVYINGTADTDLSGSESGTTLDITDIPLYLGVDFWATDRYWNGYIDDFRVSDLDRYASGNFTAPTKAFADKGQ